MKTIFKYILEVNESPSLFLPENSTILKVGVQNNNIVIWASICTESNKEIRRFKVYPTGVEIIEKSLSYIGTVEVEAFVFHIFEIIKR